MFSSGKGINKNLKFQQAKNIFHSLNQHFPDTLETEVIGRTYDENQNLTNIIVKVLFSKTNLQKFQPRTHSNLYSVDIASGISSLLNDLPIDEATNKDVVAKTEKNDHKLIVRSEPENEKALYLEHWDSNGYQTSLKLPD